MTSLPYNKGGSEIWVQVEIAYLIKKAMGIPIKTVIPFREERVFAASSWAADFVFEPDIQRGTVPTKGLVVELKVESSSLHGASFARQVKEDQTKLRSEFKPKYKDYDKAVIAIAWSPATHKALQGTTSKMVPVGDAKIDLKDQGFIIQLYSWDKDRY